jgi:transaldolase
VNKGDIHKNIVDKFFNSHCIAGNMSIHKSKLRTKIFLDSADPKDTKEALELLGFLDGQTTNPTLMSKHPRVVDVIMNGGKFTEETLMDLYKETVVQISKLIPDGSVSIEVNSHVDSTAESLYNQAKSMNRWVPNAHIKFPTFPAGINAAHSFVSKDKGKVNMTLGFNQNQAAAVYSATLGAPRGSVFYSSFIGRLFDNGTDGVENLRNVINMYSDSDHHVEVLACSFRNLDQLLACLQMKVDIVTISLKLIKEWALTGFYIPNDDDVYEFTGVKKVLYEDIDLNKSFHEYNVEDQLTTKGLESFSKDWDALI